MDVTLWLKTLLIILLVTTVFYVISLWRKKRAKFSSISGIPSPPGLPLIGHVHLFLGSKGPNPLNTLMTLAKKHKSGIFRLELFDEWNVFIFKPKYLQTFYTMNSMERASFYRPLDDIVNPSSFLSHGALWKKLRKLILLNFFGTPLRVFHENFQRASIRLVEDLREKANGQPFTFHDYALFTTGSTICHNAGHDNKIDEFKNYFTYVIPYLLQQAFERNFVPLYYFKPIFKLTQKGREFYRLIKSAYRDLEPLYETYQCRLSEKLKNGETVPEFYVYKVINSKEPKKQVVSELFTLLGAGTDTTGNTFGFTLIVLGLYPEVQEKILEEDREILGNLQGRKQTVEDLRSYKYLECVIKETLRLFPVGPLIGRKLEEDTKFGDYVIPSGTNVLALQMQANHDPEIFPEPFAFKPERFFKENESSIPPYAYNPFSAGPRNCPGKHYAMTSLKTFVPAILREYRVLSVYKNLEEAISNVEAGTTLYDKNDFPIRLVSRN